MLDAIADHFDELLNQFTMFASRTQWKPIDESAPLEYERLHAKRSYGPGAYWSDDEINFVHAAGVMHTAAAAQYLEAVTICLRSREVVFPIAPLVRSALENCGYVNWLLYHGNAVAGWSVRDRVARALFAQLADRGIAGRTAQLLNLEIVENIEVREQEIRSRLGSMFYPSEKTLGKKGKITDLRFGHQVPRVSQLASWLERNQESQWNSAGIYAVLSNATHPTFSVLTELVSLEEHKATFKMENPTYVYRMCRAGYLAVSETWRLLCAYLGYEQDTARELGLRLAGDPFFENL